jgi:hypothetical protein
MLARAALVLAACGGASCLSVQYRGADGRARALGVAFESTLELEEGELQRIRAPGLALRIWPPPVGLTLGFAEEVVFLAEGTDETRVAVGFQHTVFGLAVTSESLALGYDRTMLVPAPPAVGLGVVQVLRYDAAHPGRSIVYRKVER